jgi:hypothetical protein
LIYYRIFFFCHIKSAVELILWIFCFLKLNPEPCTC